MKKFNITLAAILFAIALFSCNKADLPTGTSTGDENTYFPKPPGGGGSNSNPAIVWKTNDLINNASVDVFWVMDANGANQTRLYYASVFKGKSLVASRMIWDPHWSADGSSICFVQQTGATGNDKSLFKLNVTLVNGVPTATNVTNLYDGPSNNSLLTSDNYWSFGSANEIIFITQSNSDGIYRIQAISANGGTPTAIYTGASGVQLRRITVSPDGSQIAFTSFDGTDKFLKVINRSDGSEIYSIQFNSILGSIAEMDWARTSGSTTIAFYGHPLGSSTATVYTMDVTDANTLTTIVSGARSPSWSPDDLKLVYSGVGLPDRYLKTITLSDGTINTLVNSTSSAVCMHWKK